MSEAGSGFKGYLAFGARNIVAELPGDGCNGNWRGKQKTTNCWWLLK